MKKWWNTFGTDLSETENVFWGLVAWGFGGLAAVIMLGVLVNATGHVDPPKYESPINEVSEN